MPRDADGAGVVDGDVHVAFVCRRSSETRPLGDCCGLVSACAADGRRRSRTGQHDPWPVDVDPDDGQPRRAGRPVSWGKHVPGGGPCHQRHSAPLAFRLERLGTVSGGRERRCQAILARHASGAGSPQPSERFHQSGRNGLKLRLAPHRYRGNRPMALSGGALWRPPAPSRKSSNRTVFKDEKSIHIAVFVCVSGLLPQKRRRFSGRRLPYQLHPELARTGRRPNPPRFQFSEERSDTCNCGHPCPSVRQPLPERSHRCTHTRTPDREVRRLKVRYLHSAKGKASKFPT